MSFDYAPFGRDAQDDTSERRRAFEALKAGLKGGGGPAPRVPLESLIPSAVPALDRLLGGGFPRGVLVVLEGGAGRWSIAARLIAQVTRRALAAVVDDGSLYPPSLERAGVRLERLLVVPATTPLHVARATDILLRSRACRLVLLPAVSLRDAVWARLANLAHRNGVLLIAVAAAHAGAALAAAAGVRLRCALERVVIHGTRGVWCTFAGFDLRAELCKHKRGGNGTQTRLRAAECLDGAPVRERAVGLRRELRDVAVR